MCVICCERNDNDKWTMDMGRTDRISQTKIIAIWWSCTCVDERHWNRLKTIYKNSNHTQCDGHRTLQRTRKREKTKKKKTIRKELKVVFCRWSGLVWVAVNEIGFFQVTHSHHASRVSWIPVQRLRWVFFSICEKKWCARMVLLPKDVPKPRSVANTIRRGDRWSGPLKEMHLKFIDLLFLAVCAQE